MAIKILIPTALRSFTGRNAELEVEGDTVAEALSALTKMHPDIKKHLYQDDSTELRSFINVFVGETNIKKLDGLNSKLSGGETVMLVPAIAGGFDN
ncbi:MAG: MoaD/ThiS family protein [Termitinemataceae bacterium]|nr:MAG: MoaD/ThiS family protein [Termitinemataceae bacterium]